MTYHLIIFVTSELNFVRWTTDMIYSTPILSVGVMRDSPLLNLNAKKKKFYKRSAYYLKCNVADTVCFRKKYIIKENNKNRVEKKKII